MSQRHDSIPTITTIKKSRRTRQRHNQPVLVTTIESTNPSPQIDVDTNTSSEQMTEIPTMSESIPETPDEHILRFPKFFSRVDKNDLKYDEIAKARLARANHDKVSRDSKAPIAKTQTKNNTKLQSKTTEHREPLFKVRHFVGMTIYLFGAQLLLPYEFAFARQLGIDRTFFTLHIFNNSIPISLAIFLNIATLILFLYILVKLDLLPNTASAKLRAEQKAREQQSKHRQNAAPAVKNAPPPMKLGVKGQDDDLYRAYRASQRREKKR